MEAPTPPEAASTEGVQVTLGKTRRHRQAKFSKAFIAGVLAICLAIFGGAGVALYFALEAQALSVALTTERETVKALNEAAAAKTTAFDELSRQLEEARATITAQQEVLDSREEFLTLAEEAAVILSAARGKVSTEELEATLQQAEATVAGERSSKAVVEAAGARVVTAREAVEAALAGYAEDSVSSVSPLRGPVAPGEDASAQLPGARAALNAVGGSWVKLALAPVVCSLEKALACATPDGTITIVERLATKDQEWWSGYMAHEYAHQLQFQQWGSLQASPGYAALFEKDVEWLADCMAMVKVPSFVSGYRYYCSPEQLSYSAEAWAGTFA